MVGARPGGGRRLYSLDFKLLVLKESAQPGASISAVALRHGINTNMVFRWRRELRRGELTGLKAAGGSRALLPAMAPVRVVEPALPAVKASPPEDTAPAPKASRRKPGMAAITLPGGATLRVDSRIDETALRRLLLAVKELA